MSAGDVLREPHPGLARRLVERFLAPIDARRIGLMRIVCCAVGIAHLPELLASAQMAHGRPPALYELPIAARPIPIPWPPPPDWHGPLAALTWISGALACAGLATRCSLAVFALMLAWLTTGDGGLGIFDHEVVLELQALVVLICCPGSSALSLDGAIARWRHGRTGPRQVMGWGFRLILGLLAVIYFTAGLSKVRFSDGRWFDGQTLQAYYGRMSYDMEVQFIAGVDRPTPAQRWKDGIALEHYLYICRGRPLSWRLARSDGLMAAISTIAVVMQLLAPLMLLGPRWRNVYLGAQLLFHNTSGQFMGLPFYGYQAVIICCFDLRDLRVMGAGLLRGARRLLPDLRS